MTQKGRTRTRKPQPKHAYMYTRHNYNRHATQHNAHKHVAQTYQNTHCHCISHTITQKNYRKHSQPQHQMHVSHTRKSYFLRRNKFANVESFYCITKGHTSNVCFYRRLHLNLLPFDYLETNQPRQKKV